MLSCYQHHPIHRANPAWERGVQLGGGCRGGPVTTLGNRSAILGVPREGTVPLGSNSGLPCRPPLSPSLISSPGACLVSAFFGMMNTWAPAKLVTYVPGSLGPSHEPFLPCLCLQSAVCTAVPGQCQPPRQTREREGASLPRWAFPIGNRYQCHFSISSISVGQPWGAPLSVLPVLACLITRHTSLTPYWSDDTDALFLCHCS